MRSWTTNIVRYSLEDFTMYTVPTTQQNQQIRGTNEHQGWFLHGLIWDIVDAGDYENYLANPSDWEEDYYYGIVDSKYPTPEYIILRNGQTSNIIRTNENIDKYYIKGFSNLFNMLKGDVINAFILKQRMKDNNPKESQEIEELFNAYGY